MSKKTNAVESYLNMLCGDDNIVYLHATVNEQTEEVAVATVTALEKSYHLLYTVNSKVVIDKQYLSINSISRILKDLQPE